MLDSLKPTVSSHADTSSHDAPSIPVVGQCHACLKAIPAADEAVSRIESREIHISCAAVTVMVENCALMALAAVGVEIQNHCPAIRHAWIVLDPLTGHSITKIQGLAARMANGVRKLDYIEAATEDLGLDVYQSFVSVREQPAKFHVVSRIVEPVQHPCVSNRRVRVRGIGRELRHRLHLA